MSINPVGTEHESDLDSMKHWCKELWNTPWVTPFMIWTFWNIIRYIVVGAFIYIANNNNVNEIKEYKPYCCDCYFISKNATAYGLSSSKRFDLSYCIPQCTDCNYCKTYFNNSATSAFNYNKTNSSCPITGYKDNYSIWNKDWYAATGCDKEQISISSMYVFSKSYSAYGIWSLIVIAIYSILFNFIPIIITISTRDLCETFFRWLWIYNIFITEICSYLIFKPFQYYSYDFYVASATKHQKHVTCEIDSINNKTEHILTWAIFITLPLVIIHIIWVLMNCVYYLIKYCRNKSKNNSNNNSRPRTLSISMQENDRIQRSNNSGYIIMPGVQNRRRSSDNDVDIPKCPCFNCFWGVISIIIFVLMLLFLGLLIYIVLIMIVYGHHSYNNNEKINIIIVYGLLILSLFDSPWLWVKLNAWRECKLSN